MPARVNSGPLVFECRFSSSRISGDASVSFEKEAVHIYTPLSSLSLPYEALDGFGVDGYTVYMMTTGERMIASQLGRWLDPFLEGLWSAYNAAVRRAFFVDGQPLFACECSFSCLDDEGMGNGPAKIEVYPDALLILPPNGRSRRVPLSFLSDYSDDSYKISLTLDTDERYELSMLGANFERVSRELSGAAKAIREEAVRDSRALCSSLTGQQATEIAALMPGGSAAGLGELARISPDFIRAIDAKIKSGRSAANFEHLCGVCGPQNISLGIRSGFGLKKEDDVLWFAAARLFGAGGVMAVEFAAEGESAATFIYSFKGEPGLFVRRLNHALEAVRFRREVVSMPENELMAEGRADYRMAVRLSPALRLLRGSLRGRAIHRTEESWRREITRLMGS